MRRVVILGESNLLTDQLTRSLSVKYEIVLLSRNVIELSGDEVVECNLWNGKDSITEVLDGAFAVINLTGDRLLKKRWTSKRKAQILHSRKDAALAVKKSIEECAVKPAVWIQGSGTMYYGKHYGIMFDETFSVKNKSYLTRVFEENEKPINELKNPDVRKVVVRIAAVIGADSFLWKKMSSLLNVNLIFTPGKGQRYLPWIHIDDAVAAITFILEDERCSGIYNLVSPERIRFKDLMRGVKTQGRRVLIIPIPRCVFRLVYGEGRTKELILVNQRILSERIQKQGFTFKYDCLEDLLSNLMNKNKY